MKKIVALLLLVAMSAMSFACGGSASVGTGETTLSTSMSTTMSTEPPAGVPADPIDPYADIDFTENSVFDTKGVISLEIKTNGTAQAAAVKEVTLSFSGYTKTLSALCIENTGTWVKGVFTEFANNTELDAFVAEAGGITIEVFYLDNSTTGYTRGIVCSTESVGGDSRRSGFGIAEKAEGVPYFITGHVAENQYSTVEAFAASETEPVHIVAVYNGETKRNAIYANGTLVSSDNAAGAFTSANKKDVYENFEMGNVFYIGADPSATAGKADGCDFPSNNLIVLDVKFYDRALTEDEVKTVYAAALEMFR